MPHLLESPLSSPFRRRLAVCLITMLGVAACSGGAETTDNPEDPPPPAELQVSVADTDSLEEDGAPGILSFVVGLTTASTSAVDVDFETRVGTAVQGEDYVGRSGSVRIAPGALSATVDIQIIGDDLDEIDETVLLVLLSTSAGTLGDASAIGLILDNDAAPLVSVAGVTVDEGDSGVTTASFSVTLDAVSGRDVSVEYSTADATADSGVDFIATGGVLQIAAGQTSGAIDVDVSGESLYEADETFSVVLSAPVGAGIGQGSATGTIVNDDSPPAVSIAGVSSAEGDSGQANYRFNVSLDAVSGLDAAVAYTTVDGSASSGSDYVSTSGVFNIAGGTSGGFIDVPVIGDTAVEADESFTVVLSNPVDVSIATVVASGFIVNDDVPPPDEIVVSIVGAPSASEGGGAPSLAFGIELSDTSSNDVTVGYTTRDGTATAGEDYSQNAGQLVIPAGQTSGTVTVTVLDDLLDEADEQLFLDIVTVSEGVIGNGTASGNVLDDDAPPALSVIGGSLAEGDSGQSALTFTVSLAAASGRTVTVDYASADVSAVAGTDYTAVGGSLTFNPGDTSRDVVVQLSGDTTSEADETFNLTLSNAQNASIATATATGTISNDDAPPSLSITGGSLVEGDTGQSTLTFTVTLSAVSGQTVTVDYASADGSALAGSDYAAVGDSLTFDPGEQSLDVSVQIIGDTASEPDETFSLTLSNAQNATIATATATGTIENDDTVPALSIVGDSVLEGDSGQTALTLTVTLSAASGQTVTVDYASADLSAVAGEDYASVSGSLSFDPGELSKQVVVQVTGDTLSESDETFTVTLSNAQNASILGLAATGTIENDDTAPALSIAGGDAVEGDNGSGVLTFTVNLSAVSGQTITVDYASADVSAVAGADYTAVSGSLTFNPGDVSADVAVPVIGDTVAEPDETFTVTLSNALNASIAVGTATGTITNDDTEPGLSIAGGSLVEGDAGQSALTFTVSLSASSGQTVTVNYASADQSASAGSDYTAAGGSLTFDPGELSKDIAVQVSGDTLSEPDETFTVTLSNPVNASLVTATATGTIANDDAAPTLSIAGGNLIEGDSGPSPLTFTVSLSAVSGQTVTVDYASADGTAVAGSDYIGVSGSLTFNPGDTSRDVVVQVTGDTLSEADETFTVVLSNVQNASVAVGTATGTITNDDAAPTLSIADDSVTEGDTGQSPLTFAVSLSAASGQTVTVDYTSADGSALAGSDYTAASGSLTFDPGDLTENVVVSASGDTLFELDETFTITLSNAVNASLADDTATGTIGNDDAQPSLSIADAGVAEGDSGQSLLSLTVSLSTASSQAVTVDYASADGSAAAGSDYTAVSGSLTLTAGALSNTIDVPINGDTDTESDETFTVTLSNPQNASILDGAATGTILDDDGGLVSGLTSRPSNTSCVAPAKPTGNAAISSQRVFTGLPAFSKPVVLLQAPHESTQWYLVEKDGRILRFDNQDSVTSTSTFIDIREPTDPIDVDSETGESGLLGMAFHPDYGVSNHYVYLYYTIDGGGGASPYTSVLSRFESMNDGATLDPNSATTLLTLDQPFTNHNGGTMAFGSDGYLYLLLGDGGDGGDPLDYAQNTSNLFGAMLRIDVDSGSPYATPGDNPFAGNALCNTGTGSAACPELYAWGLRHAWKWSFDSATDELWLADVGQDDYEEVNIVELGGNYGWRCREGAHDFDLTGVCPAGLIDPVIEYGHTVGESITGGYVYRGSEIPELIGRYVFADFTNGKIFASVADGSGDLSYEELLVTGHNIAAFAVDENEELYYIDYVAGVLYRIADSGGSVVGDVPASLLATGCIDSLNPEAPASGLIPYSINAPFWSDGAVKERWYSIPDGTTITVDADGDWLFPNGTVLMKHFRLGGELFETRLFMRHTGGEWAGYTYEWNPDGADATRVVGGKTADVNGQSWIYPSESQCLRCHTQAANSSLGLEHGQLNGDFTYPGTGITANQLHTADAVDLLADPLPDTPDNLVRFADPADTGATLEERARSYLHSNCSGCHRPLGPTPSNMDLRYATDFASTQTCDVVPVSGDLGITNARIIAPGSAATSILVERASRRDVHGMPPLGSNFVDTAGVTLLSDWVNSLASCN